MQMKLWIVTCTIELMVPVNDEWIFTSYEMTQLVEKRVLFYVIVWMCDYIKVHKIG